MNTHSRGNAPRPREDGGAGARHGKERGRLARAWIGGQGCPPSFRGRLARFAAIGAAGLLVAAAVAVAGFFVLPHLMPFPEENLRDARPSRVFLDRDGNIIRAELGDEDAWRLPVALDHVSPLLVQATLAAEDERFRRHHGVDWIAVARAAFSNLTHARVVSGASTLSMQLARLASPEPRSWGAKFRQTLRALELERRRDKDWILEHYLNHAPYGGNLVGAEAAARCYFGKSAADLSLAEASLLAGLPQRPSALRPDRHPVAARDRQTYVLYRMREAGGMARDAANPPACHILERRPPPGQLEWNRLGLPMTEPHFCQLAARENEATAATVRTTLDARIQAVARQAVQAQIGRLDGVGGGAVVVIENATGAVRALVGTPNFAAPRFGQVNAAICPRSPGSALKPFIYLAAIDGGLIVPDTILDGRPLVLEDYRPQNFDDSFPERVAARQALARSLNTPAVRLLQAVGTQRVLDGLQDCGIRSLTRGANAYGLTLALGGGEVTLLELTNAYAGLARGGVFTPCRFTEEEGGTGILPVSPQAGSLCHPVAAAGERPYRPGSVALVLSMLGTYPLPGAAGIPLAWKTGTSNGYRDAWCFACNPDFTVGVWLGNHDGRPASALVGIEAAAPVAADVFRGLYRDSHPPAFALDDASLRSVELCAESGLRAGPRCPVSCPGQTVAGVPLRQCTERHRQSLSAEAGSVPCESTPSAQEDALAARPSGAAPRPEAARPSPQGQASEVRILEPAPGSYVAVGGAAHLRLSSREAGDSTWFVDGRHLGRHGQPFWHDFLPGRHTVTICRADQGLTDAVAFEVVVP